MAQIVNADVIQAGQIANASPRVLKVCDVLAFNFSRNDIRIAGIGGEGI